MAKKKKPKTKRQVIAEYIALLLQAGCAFLFSWKLEIDWLHLTDSPEQWLWVHGTYGFLKYAVFFRRCPEIVDWVKFKIGGTEDNLFRWNLANGIGLSLFQIPIFVFSASAAFVVWGLFLNKVWRILSACLIYTTENVLSGYVYGWVREKLCWHIARVKINGDEVDKT